MVAAEKAMGDAFNVIFAVADEVQPVDETIVNVYAPVLEASAHAMEMLLPEAVPIGPFHTEDITDSGENLHASGLETDQLAALRPGTASPSDPAAFSIPMVWLPPSEGMDVV
jgi:hypothetical protein